jgi:IS5 family transposase
MKPKSQITRNEVSHLFQSPLRQVVNVEHPLVKLADAIDWEAINCNLEPFYSDHGRPAEPTRVLMGLHFLKFAFDCSDEVVCARWVENPYWQYFCGMETMQHAQPIDPSSLSRWRDRLGYDVFQKMLMLTVRAAVAFGLAKPEDFKEVAVDTTVQEKAIAHPTDARLYDKARRILVKFMKRHNLPIRQTYDRVAEEDLRRHGRYCHAKQFNRAKAPRKSLRNYLGRIIREIDRNGKEALSSDPKFAEMLKRAKRIHTQKQKDQNKLYAMHAPEVHCIGKGKARKPYEFGCKVGIVTSLKDNWVLSSLAFSGNPYDGHTLIANIEQALGTLEGLSRIDLAVADKGYKGHGVECLCEVILSGTRRLCRSLKRKLKRRNSIEPVIGHMKEEHRLNRCHLKGVEGDQINALGAAIGFNFKKLLRGILLTLSELMLNWTQQHATKWGQHPLRLSKRSA